MEILRRHLIHEELSELELAWYRQDLPGVFDATGDLLYVIAGTAVQFGYRLSPRPEWAVKLDRSDVAVLALSRQVGRYMDYEWPSEGPVEYLLGDTIQFATRMDLPYDEIFDRVQAANMTKAVHTGDERVSDKGSSFVPPVYDDLIRRWTHA